MKLNKMIAIGLMGVMTMGVIAGCGADTKKAEGGVPASKVTGTVTASGSSALLPLAKLAGDQFKAKNPDVSMTINGGGSGTGLKQVFDGTVTIGNSDVAAEEKLSPEQAKQLVDHKVAVVTMATVANKKIADTVKTLTGVQ